MSDYATTESVCVVCALPIVRHPQAPGFCLPCWHLLGPDRQAQWYREANSSLSNANRRVLEKAP